jgi:hypothetical protein
MIQSVGTGSKGNLAHHSKNKATLDIILTAPGLLTIRGTPHVASISVLGGTVASLE